VCVGGRNRRPLSQTPYATEGFIDLNFNDLSSGVAFLFALWPMSERSTW
jgi:hypothetical protein